MNKRKNLSINMIIARARNKISQKALAYRTGLSYEYIHQLEANTVDALPSDIEKIAQALHIAVEQLYEDHTDFQKDSDKTLAKLAKEARQDSVNAYDLIAAINDANSQL